MVTLPPPHSLTQFQLSNSHKIGNSQPPPKVSSPLNSGCDRPKRNQGLGLLSSLSSSFSIESILIITISVVIIAYLGYMETFAASSAKLFVENHSHNRLQSHSISFLCCHSPTPTPREAAAAFLLCRPTDNPFIGKNLNHHHHLPLNRSVSSLSLPLLPRRTIVPVSLATALTASEAEADAETEAQVVLFVIFLFKFSFFPYFTIFISFFNHLFMHIIPSQPSTISCSVSF